MKLASRVRRDIDITTKRDDHDAVGLNISGLVDTTPPEHQAKAIFWTSTAGISRTRLDRPKFTPSDFAATSPGHYHQTLPTKEAQTSSTLAVQGHTRHSRRKGWVLQGRESGFPSI